MLIPTAEQQAIINCAKLTRDNILVNALAGAAKTSTLEMIASALRSEPILFLAFNRRIADEAQKRLPSHVEVRTLNSLGHRVWAAASGKRLIVKGTKMGDLYHEHLATQKGAERGRAWDERAEVLDLLRAAKRDGYVPSGSRTIARGYFFSDEWWDGLDEEVPERLRKLVDSLLSKSILAAWSGLIDYDDQIYMPVCFGAQWPKYPLVLIDEAQDLSPINHEMIAALVHKRLIAVGDPWQSIYGFRGSVFNGMALLRDRFKMKEMTLSVTFRVPKAGVLRQRERVPHYSWPEWLDAWPEGRIETLREWSEKDIVPFSAILCRNNAPLFTCALRLLSAGRNIKLVGMDIGPGLVRTLKKLGSPQATNLNDLVAAWTQQEKRKSKNAERVEDKAECLRALCSNRRDLAEAIRWAEDLFKQDGDVQLLSIHKAKGLEWPTVYHLDPWRIPSKYAKGDEELEQEKNLRYVCETRFKETLVLLDLEGFK